MKFTPIAVTLAAAGSLVAAEQHHHAHRHHHKREPNAVTVAVPGPTVIAYQLDGKEISAQEACQGIADGTLKWADGVAPPDACASTASPSPTPTSVSIAAAEFFQKTSSTSTPSSSSSSTSSSSVSTPTPSSSSASAPAASSTSASSGATGINAEFPDGVIDCSTFPSEYGAVPLDYLGLGGWSGVQQITWSVFEEVIESIVTAISGQTCTDGAMCSYACPPGYQKSQWPTAQGSTGQSVGGIQCKNGKLYKTNPNSSTLCEPGTGGVFVQNTLSQQVAVCRTDYPGTESETIPLAVAPGQTQELTCPNEDTYYQWKGMPTSAQYYLNPKGVSTEEGCQWGDGSQPIGNWAPLNVGAGFKDGQTWLSIFPNTPTTNAQLDYNVKITGNDLSQTCKYENGVFYDSAGTSATGCTVAVPEGQTATIVFY
ncbi:hypothetical protein VTN77DRAFT_6974 [Rasamsonia byssochlamydoides]|uniref:uncharacterized protein n=1 Tax=Rasamsonia byssochlamydoides TaxID=89139 RepID=UPI0037433996